MLTTNALSAANHVHLTIVLYLGCAPFVSSVPPQTRWRSERRTKFGFRDYHLLILPMSSTN